MKKDIYQIVDICKIKSGKRLPKDTDFADYKTDYPYIRARDIKDGKINTEALVYLEKDVQEKIKRYIINSGDIAITIVGASVGDVGYASENVDGYNLTENAVRLTSFSENVNSKYLLYILYQKQYKDYMQLIAGAAAQPKLGIYKVQRIKVELPNVETQNKIANILSTYDDLIENNNKRIKLLEQMAENIYKEWFVRFRFPGCETAEFENGFPKNWEQIRLGEKMTFIRGKSYSSADIQDGDKILLSMNSVRPYGGFIRDFTRVYGGKYQDKHVIKYGDLIMSITDMTQDRRIIGYVGMFDSNRTDCIMSTHLMKIETPIDHHFILNFFNVSGLSKMIAEFATGANVLGLTDSILIRIKAVLPPNDLIEQYGKTVKPYYDMIAVLKNKNDNLIKQRDLLLPRLMSGKLEV
jgi:type I restriction enzyme S subunit